MTAPPSHSLTRRGRFEAADPARPLRAVDSVVQWGVRLVWLNLWWSLLTLLGGVVFGIGPATIAAHAVASRWLRGETDLPVAATMWAHWRCQWGRRVLVSLVTAGLTGALALSWWLAGRQTPVPAAITQALTGVGLVLMAVILPHLTWVMDRTQLNTGRTILTALAAGLARPMLTLSLILIGLGWPGLLIIAGLPGLLPVCGVTVPLLAGAWCVNRVFPPPTVESERKKD